MNELGYTHIKILHAVELVLEIGGWLIEWTTSVVDLIQHVTGVLKIQPIMHHSQMNIICREVIKLCAEQYRRRSNTNAETAIDRDALSWLKNVA